MRLNLVLDQIANRLEQLKVYVASIHTIANSRQFHLFVYVIQVQSILILI